MWGQTVFNSTIFILLNNIQRRLRVLLYKSRGNVLDQGRARLDQSRVRLDQEEARVDWSGANVLGQSEARLDHSAINVLDNNNRARVDQGSDSELGSFHSFKFSAGCP